MKIGCSVLQAIFAISILGSTVSQAGISKTVPVYEPAGGARSRPFLDVVAECRHRFGGEDNWVTAEWNGYYGRTGWWCSFRRYG